MARANLGDRSLFPQLAARAYLNHAAISPPSLSVQEAVAALLADYARVGVDAVMTYVEQRTRLKGKLARLIGARPEEIALTASTTRGLTDIALCLPWQPGQRVITFAGEFPANVTPWQRAAELFALEHVQLDVTAFAGDAAPGLEHLEHELRAGVRLVAVSAVQFDTGLCMPIAAMAELCHEHGAELCVDGIQGLGVVPFDASQLGVDYLACGSQKWLMGLEGVGFVYARGDRGRALKPHVAGWLSHEEPLRFLFEGAGHLRYDRPIKSGVELFEGSAQNAMGAVALEAAVDCIAELGVSRIFEHVQGYLDQLEEGLLERGFSSLRERERAGRSGIVSVLPPAGEDVVVLRQALAELGISCSIPNGRLRFSPHWPNAMDEVPEVLAAVDRARQS